MLNNLTYQLWFEKCLLLKTMKYNNLFGSFVGFVKNHVGLGWIEQQQQQQQFKEQVADN